jgi:hypothetical protein
MSDIPKHYRTSDNNSIDPFEAWKLLRGKNAALEYIGGTAIKYLVRFDRKGTPIEDLKKALDCIQRMIKLLEEE